MSVLGRVLRRITNRDLIERSERQKEKFVRTESEGRLEVLRFLERRSAEHAGELTRAGFTTRASAEATRATQARKEALAIEHAETYGGDPLLDLLGGPMDDER